MKGVKAEMVSTKVKNSKRGFSLPVAMAVTAVLVLLSASLLFVATNSISNTSSQVGSRQAYLNVKSALEYATIYYSDGGVKFATMGNEELDPTTGIKHRVEYLKMTDAEGLAVNRNKVADGVTYDIVTTNNSADAAKAVTYVRSDYTPADASNPALLKLTAYSQYADAFGNKGKLAKLSVTYNVQGVGSVNRITIMRKKLEQYGQTYNNSITVHVKKPENLNWMPAIYAWSYKDKANYYTSLSQSASFGLTPSLNQANQNEKKANLTAPAGVWISNFADGDSRNGPTTGLIASGNNWYSATFQTDPEDVHYLNMIISRRGGILTNTTDDVQTPEMFHLWYLDANDRNIYFELKKEHIYYYRSDNWDGRVNLETDSSGKDDPTVITYVNNPRTVVHVMLSASEATQDQTTRTMPYLIDTKDSDGVALAGKTSYVYGGTINNKIVLQYEGCGWYVGIVETGGEFDTKINDGSVTRSVHVKDYSRPEAWIVLKNNSTFRAYSSEAQGCKQMGIDMSSYITIHAKAYDNSKNVSPILQYDHVAITTSAEREKLLAKITEANTDYIKENFTEESYAALEKAIMDGTLLYNDQNYISNQKGPSNSLKVKQAATGYNKAIKAIDDAIKGLKDTKVTESLRAQLQTLIDQLDALVQETDTYDYGYIVEYERVVTKARTDVVDEELSLQAASEMKITLTEAIADMKENALLEKSNLQNLIEDALDEFTSETGGTAYTNYPDDKLAEFVSGPLKKARDVLNPPKSSPGIYQKNKVDPTTKEVIAYGIDGVAEELSAAITELTKFKKEETKIDYTQIDEILGTVLSYKSTTPTRDYIADKYTALIKAYNTAKKIRNRVSSTQQQIDAQNTALRKAYDECVVLKPAGTNDARIADNKVRIYVQNWCDGVNVDTVDKIRNNAIVSIYEQFGNDASMSYYLKSLPYDSTLQMYYYDMDISSYKGFAITYSSSGNTTAVVEMDLTQKEYASKNIVALCNWTSESYKQYGWTYYVYYPAGSETKELTTLYFEKSRYKNAQGSQVTPRVITYDNNNKSIEVSVVNFNSGKNDQNDNKLLWARYVDYGKKATVSYSGANGTQAFDVNPGAGEYIIREGYDPINVNIIMPTYNNNSGSADYTISNLTTSAGDFVIAQMADYDDGYEVSANEVAEVFNVEIPDGYFAFILDCSRKESRDNFLSCGIAPFVQAFAGASVDKENNLLDASGNIMSDIDTINSTVHAAGSPFMPDAFSAKMARSTKTGYNVPRIMYDSSKGLPGTQMIKFSAMNYYYVLLPKESTFYMITYIDGYDASTGTVTSYTVDTKAGTNQWGEDYRNGYYCTIWRHRGLKSCANYYVMKYTGSNSYTNFAFWDAPKLVTPKDQIPIEDNNGSNLEMPFTGGGKLRIVNKSYGETYGWGKKKDDRNNKYIESGNRFGGKQNGNQCSGRVGDSKLISYYDWCEYKIPVSDTASFNFNIKGLDNVNSTKSKYATAEATGVYGDMWVQLNSEHLKNTIKGVETQYVIGDRGDSITYGGKIYKKQTVRYYGTKYTMYIQSAYHRSGSVDFNSYKAYLLTEEVEVTKTLDPPVLDDYSIYTYDPDENDFTVFNTTTNKFEPKKRVYFNLPSGWLANTLKISMRGYDATSKTADSITGVQARGGAYSYYYYDVPVSTPFITFTVSSKVTAADGTETQKSHSYTTTLQGGDYCLYEVSTGGSIDSGRWTRFVSDQDALKNQVEIAQSMFYGDCLVKKYVNSTVTANGVTRKIAKPASGDKSNFMYANGIFDYYKPYSTASGSSTGTITDDSIDSPAIMKMSNDAAYSAYVTVSDAVRVYNKLYGALAEARGFIENPGDMANHNGSAQFPEYLNRASTETYTVDSIEYLKTKMTAAEDAYSKHGASIADITSAYKSLRAAISSMDVDQEGSIALVLYDAQSKIKEYSVVKISYDAVTYDASGKAILSHKTEFVNDVNVENYPIIFVNQKEIRNVSFMLDGVVLQPTKDVMKENEQWVLMDTKNDPKWAVNSNYDYRDISNDEFFQSSGEQMPYYFKFDKDKQEVQPIVLYFEKNATVTYSGGSYTIYAGAYLISPEDDIAKDALDAAGNVRKYTGTSINMRVLNLYSSEAKDYFTKPESYGCNEGKLSDTIGWTTGGALTNGNKTANESVQLIANSGKFSNARVSRDYKVTNGTIYFRWDSTDPIGVYGNTSFVAPASTTGPSFTIASEGTLYGGNDAHFYLRSTNPKDESIIVRFFTDLKIQYVDAEGTHEFVIREGTYEASKSNSSNSYVWDLFDETYWQSREFIKSLGVGDVNNFTGSKYEFKDGTYGDD